MEKPFGRPNSEDKEPPKTGCWFKSLLIFGGLAGLIAGVQGIHMAMEPPEQLQKEQQQAATAAAEQNWSYKSIVIAKSAVERILKDPDSAQYRRVYVVIPKNFNEAVPGVVCGEINSKNSFGAYTGFTNYIVIGGVPIISDRSRKFIRLWSRECANKKVMGLPGIEWVILGGHSDENVVDMGFLRGFAMPETWQDEEWGNLASVVGCQTDIVLPGFARG